MASRKPRHGAGRSLSGSLLVILSRRGPRSSSLVQACSRERQKRRTICCRSCRPCSCTRLGGLRSGPRVCSSAPRCIPFEDAVVWRGSHEGEKDMPSVTGRVLPFELLIFINTQWVFCIRGLCPAHPSPETMWRFLQVLEHAPVSYTHLTLPTKRIV